MEETRLMLKNVGKSSPISVGEYINHGGYEALKKSLTCSPEDIIAQISDSGVRGRSGSNFPASIKWRMVKETPAAQKYVVCNADEGEPGTCKDRVIMTGNPHLFLEGMVICSIAVGATFGFIYLRAEYPHIRRILQEAIDDARANSFLGNNILGSCHHFDIEIRVGAGAYICGEETALLESLEGKRGEARLKPPFPGRAGLWGKPTAINNVETFANIPVILNLGVNEYRKYGTDKSPGTKLFTLSGNIANPGVYEFPMGITVRDLYEKVGGGCPGGKTLRGVQTGGSASGTFISPDMLDVTMDVEGCAEAGAVFGTGNLMFFDEDSCVVDLAKNCMEFFVRESCGQCTPCRFGNRRLLELLTKIVEGDGEIEDLDEIEKLASYIRLNSLCGLGQMAPTALISALQNFKGDFKSHIAEKYCSAGVCGFGKI